MVSTKRRLLRELFTRPLHACRKMYLVIIYIILEFYAKLRRAVMRL